MNKDQVKFWGPAVEEILGMESAPIGTIVVRDSVIAARQKPIVEKSVRLVALPH